MSNSGGGGQTESNPSGWTTDTLKEYAEALVKHLGRGIEAEVEALGKRVDDRWAAGQKALDTAFLAHQSQTDQQFTNMQRNVETAFTAQRTAMETAFTAADKAVDKALAAAEKAIEVRQNAAEREFHEHLQQYRDETKTAFEASGKAIDKAEAATEKRFESVNEFRAQLADQASRFMPRTEAEGSIGRNTERLQELTATFGSLITRAEISSLSQATDAKGQIFLDRIGELEKRVTRSEGQQSGKVSSLNGLVAGLGTLGVLVSIIVGIVIIIVNT